MTNAVKFADAKTFYQKGQNTKAVKYLIGDMVETVKTVSSGTSVTFSTKEKADEALAFLAEAGWNVWRITDKFASVGMD